MAIVYKYSGPNLRGIKKEMRKAIDGALANHRRQFMPRHFRNEAFARYPVQYQRLNLGNRARNAHRAAAIKLRFDTTPPEQWDQLRADIQSEFDASRASPNRLLPLVDRGIMQQMVLLQHAKFSGSLNARKMLIPVPWYITSPAGVVDKRAALQVIRRDESTVFAKVADRKIQQFAKTTTRKR